MGGWFDGAKVRGGWKLGAVEVPWLGIPLDLVVIITTTGFGGIVESTGWSEYKVSHTCR